MTWPPTIVRRNSSLMIKYFVWLRWYIWEEDVTSKPLVRYLPGASTQVKHIAFRARILRTSGLGRVHVSQPGSRLAQGVEFEQLVAMLIIGFVSFLSRAVLRVLAFLSWPCMELMVVTRTTTLKKGRSGN